MNKRFANPEFFGQIGRPPLVLLLGQFAPEFAAQEIELPDAELDEKRFFRELAELGASKKGLPPKLIDVLHGVMAMGNEEGKDRLIQAAARAGMRVDFAQNATCSEFALQFYLTAPRLFERKVRETQILTRSVFHVFGSRNPCPEGIHFPAPTDAQIQQFKADVDDWIQYAYRGEERATEIEYYDMEDGGLFLIRMGDSVSRHTVVEEGRFTYQHFRPGKDLVVMYSAARDEVRINGRGAKKITMLRKTFGQCFFNDQGRFSVKNPFTLAPLARLRRGALEVTPGQGIDRIVLTELVQESDSEPGIRMELKTTGGADLFEYGERENMELFLPKCRLAGAGFDIYFTGQSVPRRFFLREGNGLRQVRNCDAVALYRWMTEIGFRRIGPVEPGHGDVAVDAN
jgi:hypothetical protein